MNPADDPDSVYHLNLSVRLSNCLYNAGVRTVAEALAFAKAVTPPRFPVRNYGWHCHQELCKALGLPVPKAPDRHLGSIRLRLALSARAILDRRTGSGKSMEEVLEEALALLDRSAGRRRSGR